MMNRYKVKFFGSKSRKEQIVLTKTVVMAHSVADVQDVLQSQYGYVVINGLKINKID